MVGDIQFFGETHWKNHIDLIQKIKNSNVLPLTSSKLTTSNPNGVDNYGKDFTFWDALWFCMTSFLLGKNEINDNSYFYFQNSTVYSKDYYSYYEEYDYINIGKAIGNYKVTNYDGNNIY